MAPNPYHFDPHVESPSDFTLRLKPTQTTNPACFWLSVHNHLLGSFPSSLFTPPKEPLQRILQECTPTLEGGKVRYIKAVQHRRPMIIEDTKSTILNVASKYGLTTGKWVLFFNASQVDYAWSKIALATHQGFLGSSAKVSPKAYQKSASYLICVYTEDFNDVDEVGRVLHQLRRMFPSLHHTSIHYKPDVYTYLGLYSNNNYKIPCSIYKSTQFDDQGFKVPQHSSVPVKSDTLVATHVTPPSTPFVNHIAIDDTLEATPPSSPSKLTGSQPRKRAREASVNNLAAISSPPVSPTSSSATSDVPPMPKSNAPKKRKLTLKRFKKNL